MRHIKLAVCVAGVALLGVAASAARSEDGWSRAGPPAPGWVNSETKLARVLPGTSTKTQIHSLLGAPWRVVQFNDCGMSMPGQADETWDYRGKDAQGTYRLHIEFDDRGVADLVAKIPDRTDGGKGTPARVAPTPASKMAMKM